MKTLRTLIRLKKEDVEKLQKELSAIQQRQRILQDEHDYLTQELEKEANMASQFPEVAGSFGLFVKKTLDRQKILMKNIQLLQNAIDKKRDELLVEYGEQKKFEIALEQRQLAELNEAKRREVIRMDEVASRGHSRKE